MNIVEAKEGGKPVSIVPDPSREYCGLCRGLGKPEARRCRGVSQQSRNVTLIAIGVRLDHSTRNGGHSLTRHRFASRPAVKAFLRLPAGRP